MLMKFRGASSRLNHNISNIGRKHGRIAVPQCGTHLALPVPESFLKGLRGRSLYDANMPQMNGGRSSVLLVRYSDAPLPKYTHFSEDVYVRGCGLVFSNTLSALVVQRNGPGLLTQLRNLLCWDLSHSRWI